jgi:hypothetical protein
MVYERNGYLPAPSTVIPPGRKSTTALIAAVVRKGVM